MGGCSGIWGRNLTGAGESLRRGNRGQVVLSHSPRDLRAADALAASDAEARQQRRRQAPVLQSRAITHPNFRNLTREKVPPSPPTCRGSQGRGEGGCGRAGWLTPATEAP